MDNLTKEEKLIANIIALTDYYHYPDNKIIQMYEREVLALNSAYLSYYFARNIKGVNIKAHERALIKNYNFDFYAASSFAKDEEQIIEKTNDFSKSRKLAYKN